jgi:predicted transposase YbfD/YdcC
MLPDPRPYFAELIDPRRETRNKLHPLETILMIVLCATLSGEDDWVGMEIFAEERADWLRQFVNLDNGIPSHDTLSDVMGRIDSAHFSALFAQWMRRALPSVDEACIAVDGKTLRGSREQGKATVHLVSAFATQARLVLGQQAVADKSNEITAIPELLSLLELSGATVSIDAMGCQKSIAQCIVARDADYVLALKDNHPTLCEEVALWLDSEFEAKRLTVLTHTDKGHGRIEERCYAISDRIDWLSGKAQWPGLQAVGMVESLRLLGDTSSRERRYFILSFTDLERFAESVRSHWAIENQQHWVLDVHFNEDGNRSRKDHSAKNLGIVRHVALNMIRHNDPNSKRSLKQRRRVAGYNNAYRSKLMGLEDR